MPKRKSIAKALQKHCNIIRELMKNNRAMPTLPKKVDKLTLEEYVEMQLPENSNEQDRVYLAKRYQYEAGKIDFKEVSKCYIGTSFQLKLYPNLKPIQ